MGGHLADINEISEEYNGPIVASQESEPDAGSFDPTRDAYEILEYASDGSQAGDRTNEDFLRAMHSNDVTDERYSPSDYGEGSQFEEDFMYAMRCEPDKKFNGDSTYLSDDGSVDNLRFREFNTTDSVSGECLLAMTDDAHTVAAIKGRGNKVFEINVPKEAIDRPKLKPEEKLCLVTYVDVGGCQGLTLWDSGSNTSSISPGFSNVAKLDVRRLKEPVPLYLGTVGSRSVINFGTMVDVSLPRVSGRQYFDITNLDRYDVLIGTPFMLKHGVILDFESQCVRIGNTIYPGKVVPVNPNIPQRFRMRRPVDDSSQSCERALASSN